MPRIALSSAGRPIAGHLEALEDRRLLAVRLDTLGAFGDVMDFRISPDGQYAVYLADQDDGGVDELFSVQLATGVVTKLNAPLVSGGDVGNNFQISPDSSRVVYWANQEVVTQNSFVLDARRRRDT